MAGMYTHAPTDTHPHGVMTMMQRKWNLKGMWFIDNWPATAYRQLVIAEPVSCLEGTIHVTIVEQFMIDSLPGLGSASHPDC